MLSWHWFWIVVCSQVFSRQPTATHVQLEDVGGEGISNASSSLVCQGPFAAEGFLRPVALFWVRVRLDSRLSPA